MVIVLWLFASTVVPRSAASVPYGTGKLLLTHASPGIHAMLPLGVVPVARLPLVSSQATCGRGEVLHPVVAESTAIGCQLTVYWNAALTWLCVSQDRFTVFDSKGSELARML